MIDQETIRNQGAQTLADLLLGYPGISVSRQGPNGTLTQVRMRGAEANHVLVLIDGVEANDVTQGSEFNLPSFLSIKSSVLRSPVVLKALWGSDALAGVIHITTRPVQVTSLALPSPLPSAIAMQIESVSNGAIAGTITSLTSGSTTRPLQNRTSLESAANKMVVSTDRNARHQIDLRVH